MFKAVPRAASRVVSASSKPRCPPILRHQYRAFAHCSQRSQQSRYGQPKRPSGRPLLESARILFRAHPYQVSLASFFILCGIGGLFYVNYVYNTYIIGAFHKFPEPVAVKMRRALYYTNYDLQPKQAIKYYRQALQIAEEMGMDPFSDEILGVKIQVAAFYEKLQNYQAAIDVLELVKRDCLKWEELLGQKEGNEGKRTRVLTKTVQISLKLGDLYSNEYIQEREKAEETLVWAVETILRERQRRQMEGTKPGEGEWISDDEAGAALEALGHIFESQSKHYLAAPLFLQALSFRHRTDCHSVILMNNLSISLAQQLPPTSSASPTSSNSGIAFSASPSSSPAPSRTQLIETARQWATKAIDIAAYMKPPERTEECDVGCAVATHNLGELAEMAGNLEEARRKYEEAQSLSKVIGFQDGVRNAAEGLRRLGKTHDDRRKWWG